MVGEGQRVTVRVEHVGVEQVRGLAEGLVDVPGHDVGALQRVADVGHGVARVQREREEAGHREQRIQGEPIPRGPAARVFSIRGDSTVRHGHDRAREGWTRSADGTALFWRSWRSAAPRAGLAIVHGLGEHSGRYDHVGQSLAERGFDCWAGDCRGHGMSPGPRVHVDDFASYAEDAGAILDLAAAPGRPLFLLGHSQGGLVALLRALRHPSGLDGVVVSSPILAPHPAAAPSARPPGRRVGPVPGRAVVRHRAASLDTGALSHDPAVETAVCRRSRW